MPTLESDIPSSLESPVTHVFLLADGERDAGISFAIQRRLLSPFRRDVRRSGRTPPARIGKVEPDQDAERLADDRRIRIVVASFFRTSHDVRPDYFFVSHW